MASEGEGSRGGKVIGHTRSGKPIYDSERDKQHHLNTLQDHNDASRAHDEEAHRNPARADYHRGQAAIYRADADHQFAKSEGYKNTVAHRAATQGPGLTKYGKQLAADAERRANLHGYKIS